MLRIAFTTLAKQFQSLKENPVPRARKVLLDVIKVASNIVHWLTIKQVDKQTFEKM